MSSTFNSAEREVDLIIPAKQRGMMFLLACALKDLSPSVFCVGSVEPLIDTILIALRNAEKLDKHLAEGDGTYVCQFCGQDVNPDERSQCRGPS